MLTTQRRQHRQNEAGLATRRGTANSQHVPTTVIVSTDHTRGCKRRLRLATYSPCTVVTAIHEVELKWDVSEPSSEPIT